MSINQATEYSNVVTAVTAAVRQDINTVNKWQNAGASVRAFFGTETAINEVKAQFIADAIIPAMDKKHATALLKETVRKGSAEYNALDSAGRDAWEATNTAKKDARAVAHTMFSRVVKYAFPREKTESESKSLETKLAYLINEAIGKCEKAEAASFDVLKTIEHLKAALSIITK
jgi:hypothetical protein